jgi:oxygen-dependent protoporphyrinogen oxidase
MSAIAVVGGGITGLAAAWDLCGRGHDVTVYEASERLGGKIRTAPFAGVPTEAGPDAVLARVPWAAQLVSELGLDTEAVHPATGSASIWSRGKLRPLPDGLVLGVPGRLLPVARSGILTPLGMARAGLDVVLPKRATDDPSVAEVIAGRFGREVLEKLVDPLVSGINAGRADRLSIEVVAPDVAAVARDNRSLLLALRKRPPVDRTKPVFLSLADGLQRLVERLDEALRARGVEIVTGARVTELPDADAVVLTVPAFTAADLVGGKAGDELRTIEYASVSLATMTYPAVPLERSGFLVPRSEGWLMTAGTFVSTKWPARRPDGRVMIRCSAGRFGDDRHLDIADDAALVDRLHGELSRAVDLRGARPIEWRVDRWPRSFPQSEPGHLARVARIEDALPGNVFVAGAAYRGVGIASCIRQAREIAARVDAATR